MNKAEAGAKILEERKEDIFRQQKALEERIIQLEEEILETASQIRYNESRLTQIDQALETLRDYN